MKLTHLMTLFGMLAAMVTPAIEANDGELDPTFGFGGQVTTDFGRSAESANAVAVQADGKLVVAGATLPKDDLDGEDFALARYNPDGSLDSTFGTQGKVRTDFPGLEAVISAVMIQPDGKIVVAGGAFPLLVFLGDLTVARYNSNGSLDTSFGEGGIVRLEFGDQGSYGFALALQSDGKIIVTGTHFVDFSTDDSSNTDFALARLNSDGSFDPAFGSSGLVTTDFDTFNDDAFSVLIQPDGKIVAVGSAKNPANFYDFAAARYLSNGTLDTTFGIAGKARTDFGAHDFDRARSAVLQPDGRLVAAGFAISRGGGVQNFALARYDSNGRLDSTFGNAGKAQVDFGSCCQSAYGLLRQSDGRLIAVGYPNSGSSDSDFLLTRLNENATLDETFGIGGQVRTSFGDLNGGANAAVLQSDGKIVAVGFQATASAKTVEFAVARYENRPAFSLTSAVSRVTHAGAGPFDIPLPLTGEPGVECRGTRGRYAVVFNFSREVVSGAAEVTAGIGMLANDPVFAGNSMMVDLSDVSDVQELTLTVSSLMSSTGDELPEEQVTLGILIGDANGDRVVDQVDAALTRGQIGRTVTGDNFRQDLNRNGAITDADQRTVKANAGHALP